MKSISLDKIVSIEAKKQELSEAMAAPDLAPDEFVRLSILLNDLGLPLEQDDEVIRLIAVADEHIARRDALLRPIAA